MQKSESRTRGKPRGLDLDLSPPVRVGLWAVTLAAGIIFGTVAPPLGVALVFASLLISAGAIYWRDLVPESWRMMAVLAPLFAAGGVSIASLHLATPDPLAELAAMQPGEVTVVGKIASPPVRGGFGYRADLQVEHLWYEEKEVLRGGRLQVFAGDLRVGVGDEVRVDGELTSPESGESGFDYGRYLGNGHLLKNPERLRAGLDEMIECERGGMRGDPEQEAKTWLEKLAAVDQECRGYLRQNARGILPDVELDEALAELEETRVTVEQELAGLQGRREAIETLERDRSTLLDRYADEIPETIDALSPEERHRVYKMLGIGVVVNPDTKLEVSGLIRDTPLFSNQKFVATYHTGADVGTETFRRNLLL